MTRGPEARLEDRVCQLARRIGALPVKLVAASSTGFPDRMFLYRGRVVFMEFKSPTGKLSKKQLVVMRNMAVRGFAVHVVRDYDTAVDVFTERFSLYE